MSPGVGVLLARFSAEEESCGQDEEIENNPLCSWRGFDPCGLLRSQSTYSAELISRFPGKRIERRPRWSNEMRLVALALNLLIFCVCLQASAQEQKPITVRGKLVNIMGVRGESTGWAVELDSAISVDGKQVDSIELDGLTKKAQKLQDKQSRSWVSSPTGTELSAATGQSSRSSP